MKKEPNFAEAIANLLVLSVITGKDATEVAKYVGLDCSSLHWALLTVHSTLKSVDAQHPLLTDLAEKSDLFDKAATKYKAKVAA
jgi:coatomer protein complex subunit epsilon